MHNWIISDTRCLILFHKIGALDLLWRVYGVIIITPEIAAEFGLPLPEWIKVETPKNKAKQKELESMVDIGEASAIALALELPDSILIIDDKRGRILAQKLHIEVTGTLGTLLKAKQRNIIPQIKPFIEELKKIDYRISSEIEEGVLKSAGEL